MPQPDQRSTADQHAEGTLAEDTVATTHDDATRTFVEELGRPSARMAAGAKIGDYEILRRVGSGGMGEVYAVRRPGLDRTLALKTLSEVHAARLYRFKREFRALADVKHDNLVALDELVVLADGRAFFTMELIDGVDFVAYVRGDTPKRQLPNLVRLERALRQLVTGIHHLHRHRCIHRDIKPSNVLVTREGRVVILDFGVISEIAEGDDGSTRDGQMMGTPAYMAPEQAGGLPAGPAADYYALGTMLFECLTGELPFRGSILDILIDKRHGEVPDPRAQLDGFVTQADRASALIELCRRALIVDPEQRARGEEFRATLGEARDRSGSFSKAPAEAPGPSDGLDRTASTPAFVGRANELAVLEAGLAEVTTQLEPVTIHIRGNSGQGKSALVARFLARARARERTELVTLRGRCLERESVPYKGVDSIVDALSSYLRRLDQVEAARLQPRHLGALLQLFPVLDDAWADDSRIVDHDPGELRRRGFAALREVLAKVGQQRPLVVSIDDFQWADVDSARLLTELMRPPDPPAMLLVVSFRDEVDEREVLQLLTSADALAGREVHEIELGPLSREEAQELAASLMRERATSRAGASTTLIREGVEVSAEALARRAQGNPFYIGQMVLGDDSHSSSDASLDRLVARRIVALDPLPRRVLATVAVAAGPTPTTVVLKACARIEGAHRPDQTRDGGETLDGEAIAALLAANLLRRSEDAGADEADEGRIETAHDRIRVVAVGELSPTELRETHLALGHAFEQLGGGQAEALAEHFSVGGDHARALDYTEKAAADAASALAFERAAELYRRALGFLAGPGPASHHGSEPTPETETETEAEAERRRALERGLAEQLINLGRGFEAAQMLISLAAEAATPKHARELRRRAASELVKAGYLDEGMDTITPVLRELGIWHPRGPISAVLGTVWNRLLMSVRGYRFTVRREDEIDPALLERLDCLIATKTGLSHNEAIFAGYQQSKAIRLGLAAGEPRRLIRCLVHDAAIMVAIGRVERGRALLQTARELVELVVEPEFRRVVEYVDMTHHDQLGRWPEADQRCAELQRGLDETPNAGWIRGASMVQWMYVRKLLGRYALLRAELPERVATARELGVRHEQVSLACLAAYIHTIYGEPEPAQRLIDEARERGAPRQVTFQRIMFATTEVELALLAGDPSQALAVAERVLGDLRHKLVAKMIPSHVDFHELRGRSRVRLALDGVEVGRNLALVRRDLGQLRRNRKPQVGGQALVIEAAVLACEGDLAGAEQRWRAALAEFERLAMHGHVAAVQTRLGSLGDEPARAAAERFFAEQGIADPSRLVDALAPGIDPSTSER
jgi:eukaryotic-like serine/threonine-protein kinase